MGQRSVLKHVLNRTNDRSPNRSLHSYVRSANGSQFIKLGVQPDRITLFSHRNGDWTTMGAVDYNTPLEFTRDGKRVWHPATVKFDAEEQTIRIDTTGGHWASFNMDRYYPARDTYAGTGCDDGVAWFRNLEIT